MCVLYSYKWLMSIYDKNLMYKFYSSFLVLIGITDFRKYGLSSVRCVKSHSWSENQIMVRVSKVGVSYCRVRKLRAGVKS